MGRPKKGVEKSAPSSLGVDEIISHLQKHGSGYTTRMIEEKSVITVPKFLSTGLPNIDHMLGGGIPAGRITELFSKGEGVGKSSLAAQIIAQMQQQGGKVILMDTEHGLTEERMRTFDIDINEIIYQTPDHIQGACQNISDVLRMMKESNDEKGILIVWDSVTGTPSKAEFEADYGDILVASGARAWSASLKKLKDELARSEVYCLMVSQTRMNIGQMYGDKQQATGGMGIKYYAGQRIVMTREGGAWLKDGPQRLGFKVTMETQKSRLAAPYQKAVASLIFDHGYDRWKSLFDLLIKLELITQKGAWYTLEGVEKSFQMKDFEKAVKTLDSASKDKLTKTLVDARVNEETVKYFF